MKHKIFHQSKIDPMLYLVEEFDEPLWVQRHRQVVEMAENNSTLKQIVEATGYAESTVQNLLLRYEHTKK